MSHIFVRMSDAGSKRQFPTERGLNCGSCFFTASKEKISARKARRPLRFGFKSMRQSFVVRIIVCGAQQYNQRFPQGGTKAGRSRASATKAVWEIRRSIRQHINSCIRADRTRHSRTGGKTYEPLNKLGASGMTIDAVLAVVDLTTLTEGVENRLDHVIGPCLTWHRLSGPGGQISELVASSSRKFLVRKLWCHE